MIIFIMMMMMIKIIIMVMRIIVMMVIMMMSMMVVVVMDSPSSVEHVGAIPIQSSCVMEMNFYSVLLIPPILEYCCK